MANEGRETSEGCDWSDDLLLGKSWKSSKIGIWKFCVIRKCHRLILFVGLCRSNPLYKLVNIVIQYKKNQNPLYLTTHENNITEIAFLHRWGPSPTLLERLWDAVGLAVGLRHQWRLAKTLGAEPGDQMKFYSLRIDVDIYIYSSGFTEFPVLIVRHHQMNLWFYSLTRLKMRSCLRCECKSARWRKGDITFSQHVSLQLHDIAWSLQEQCIVGHQEEFVLTGATGTPWCVLYTVPVLLTCWKCFSIGGLCLTLLWDNPKPGLLRNVKKKCGLPLVKKGHQQLPGCNGLRDARTEAVTTRWILIFWAKRWCFMCCNLYIA